MSELLVVAVAAVLAETLTVFAFLRVQRSTSREAARERDRLVNQLCNLAGRPWEPAPADDYEVPQPEPALVSSPEQLPDW